MKDIIMQNEKLEVIKKEVIQVNEKILNFCEKDERLMKMYKGCVIYLSPLFKNPDIFILGINPGSGYYRANKKIIQQFEPMSKHDFIYEPWKQIKNCFSRIEKANLLDNSVVTNLYFFSTYNEKELDAFFKLLPNEFRREVLSKSELWIRTIIYEISPKNILCVGAKTKNILKSLYKEYNRLEGSKHTEVGKINEITIFSFNRLFSRIRNKKELIKYLDKYMNANK